MILPSSAAFFRAGGSSEGISGLTSFSFVLWRKGKAIVARRLPPSLSGFRSGNFHLLLR